MPTETIGSTPAEEDCAQVGSSHYDFSELNSLECRAYCVALRRKYGEPPEGSKLLVHHQDHDFGRYGEAAYRFDPDREDHIAYYGKIENGLKSWEEAGMQPPVLYSERGGVILIRRTEEQWVLPTASTS